MCWNTCTIILLLLSHCLSGWKCLRFFCLVWYIQLVHASFLVGIYCSTPSSFTVRLLNHLQSAFPKMQNEVMSYPFSFFANYAIGRKSFLLTIKVGKSEGKKEWRRAELIGNSSLRFWNKLDIKLRKGQNRFIIFMSDVEEKKKVRRS